MRCPPKRKLWWRRVRIPAAQLGAAKVSKPEIRQNPPNSYDISKGFFQSGICEFESSVVSQPFRLSENFLLYWQKGPPMAGFSNY
jgi:hypothetical protein